MIALVILLFSLILYQNDAFAQVNNDELKITNIQQIKAGHSQFFVSLQYCNIDRNSSPIGAIVSSNIGKNIVALDSKIKNGQCQPYASKVNAEKTSQITAKLFDEESVDDYAKQFEARLVELGAKKENALKQLRIEKSLSESNYKKIERIEKSIILLDQAILNSKHSLHTLRALV